MFDLLGFFYNVQTYFSNYWGYNIETNPGSYVLVPDVDPLIIMPQDLYYAGNIVVLTDAGTVSSGEAFALGLQRLPQVHVLSYYSTTKGSISDNETMVYMPRNPSGVPAVPAYKINYGIAYLADQNQTPLIQADKNFIGGIKADVKIPFTEQTAIDVNTNGKDPVLDFAQQCLHTKCWKEIDSNSDSNLASIMALITAGVGSTAAAACLAK